MKNFLFILILILVVGNTVYGQATASFTASVTIIKPLGINTTSNMNFASIDAKSGGAVTVTPKNTRTATGGVVLEEGNKVSAASFKVTGEHGFSYSLSLPNKNHILTNGTERMVIKDFTSSLAGNEKLNGSSKLFRVGATLNVHPHQAPGVYTSSTPMNVTVNYN